MKTLMIAALLGTAAAGGVAVAQSAGPVPRLLKGDANADGRLSRIEFVRQAETRFAALDTNNDGALTGDEAWSGRGHGRSGAFGAIGQDTPPPPQPGAMRGSGGPRGGGMARLDTDGDGKLTRAEYDAGSTQRFARMDTNGDGIVDKSEMAALPGGGRMAGRIDGDGNGTLTRAEFDRQAGQRFARMDMNADGVIDAAELQAGPMARGGRGGPRPAGAPAPIPPAPTGA